MKGETVQRLLHNKYILVGGLIAVVLLAISASAPLLVRYDPVLPDYPLRLQPPDGLAFGDGRHPLGTDPLGRDILTRLLIGSRYSFVIGIGAVFGSALLGTALGLVSGYYGGPIDSLLMRLTDIQLAIPPTLLAIVVAALLGPSIPNLILVLIITSWPTYARVIRANVLVVRDHDYVAASRMIGGSNLWIMVTQILPNILTPLLILTTQQFGYQILMEAGLSFLGMGVQPPTPSWGVMIADGRDYIATAPWVVLAPGIALLITVVSFNLLGDGLRDVLDPKMRV